MRTLFVLSIAWFLLTSAVHAASCQLDNSLPDPRPVRTDWQNKNTKTDYYALALSWSPQHCANPQMRNRNRFQCQLNQFEFVVHGLWPQSSNARNKFGHPRHCRDDKILPRELVRKHVCTVPGADLMQGEWIKHGTCAFDRAENYFGKIEELWSQLNKPSLQTSSRQGFTVGELKESFVAANKKQGLKADHLVVWVNNRGYLRELVVCYDLKYSFIGCSMRGTPDHQPLRVRLN